MKPHAPKSIRLAVLLALPLFAAFGQVITGPGSAPPGLPGSITGTVSNGPGSEIPGVTVTLSGIASGIATTDTGGNFTFNNLPTGASYTLAFFRPGYTFLPQHVTGPTLIGAQWYDVGYWCNTSMNLISNFAYWGGDRTTTLNRTAGCPWTSQSSVDFARLNFPTSGSGGASITLNADIYTGNLPRTGSAVVGGLYSRFTQGPQNFPSTYQFDDVAWWDGGSIYWAQGSAGFANHIALMKHYFITNGCSATSFCPEGPLYMEQMAVFLVRAILHQSADCEAFHPMYPSCTQTVKHGYPFHATDNPQGFTYSTEPAYGDVAPAHPFFPYIRKLRDLGVYSGCGGGNFCPGSIVTRGQMAELIVRSLIARNTLTTDFFYPPTPFFADVPSSHPAFPYVQRILQQGITSGLTATTYGPDTYLARYSMAVFLVRAFFTAP
jgi:hypothetical protein